jgi:hypothetical protein
MPPRLQNICNAVQRNKLVPVQALIAQLAQLTHLEQAQVSVALLADVERRFIASV